MKKGMILAVLVFVSACGPVIKVSQPTIIGSSGKVYQTTEAEVSMDILNNSNVVGDVLVGETLIYEGVKPQEVKNVGFFCDGLLTLEAKRLRLGRAGDREEYVYFRPQDGRYKVESRPVHVSCGRRHKTQFNIRSVERIRSR